ncbi:hypothetical protein PYJP_19780 [Pyrofollis japonicus]|uniref:30S ribosomal protein S24e n=1 Tax=Pyrofollis japonicus TaxID=3060460 RepID=UPI00295BC31A|nr:30S ribosomal protein S24e [Pyrofollis japonicus]BEP18626.1 hypothetical protein PYJP_19780 [Pyrofollis japonicus]
MSQQIPREVIEMFIPKGSKKLEVDLGEGYEVYVTKDWYNPLIKRREIDATIIHVGKPTPSRMKLRTQFAKALNVDFKRVYIRSVKSEYGVGISRIEVHVYDDVERALQFEPKYIIERNKLPEEMEE